MYSQERHSTLMNRHPEIRELFSALRDLIQQNQRPPDQVVLDDEGAMAVLKTSKRKLRILRDERKIAFSQERKGTPYTYFLSDLLDYVRRYRVESLDNLRKI